MFLTFRSVNTFWSITRFLYFLINADTQIESSIAKIRWIAWNASVKIRIYSLISEFFLKVLFFQSTSRFSHSFLLTFLFSQNVVIKQTNLFKIYTLLVYKNQEVWLEAKCCYFTTKARPQKFFLFSYFLCIFYFFS